MLLRSCSASLVSRLTLAALVGTLVLLLPTLAAAQPHDDRPADSLLQRSDLQALVDAQVQRDGAALRTALDDADPAIRARAAFALASVQDPKAGAALTERLRDSVSTVRADAAFAYGQLPPDSVSATPLLDALRRETDATVQRRLIEAIGKVGDAEALDDFLQVLVTQNLPEALGPDIGLTFARFGMRDVFNRTSTAWLPHELTASDPAMRMNAAYFFGRIPETDVWAQDADVVRDALDRYQPTDPAAMHLLRGLGRLADSTDAARIREWLETGQDWRIRVNAARALRPHTGAEQVRTALRTALDDSVRHVGITAAQVLSAADWSAADAKAVGVWMDAHPDAWRMHAPLLVGWARNADAARVLDAVDRWKASGNAVAHAAMLAALAPLDTAWTRLAEAAQSDDPRVASAALNAAGSRWTRVRSGLNEDGVARYEETFLQGLARADVATVNAVASVLTDSIFVARGSVSDVADTYRSLSSPDDLEGMLALLRALGDVPEAGEDEVDALLRDALEHPHPRIRDAAASAVSARTGETVTAPADPPAETRPIDWAALADLGPSPRLVLDTERGRIVLTLDAEQAPQTVQTICRFAEDGRYDGVPFHRVIANFVAQGGDFAREDGWGGPGFFLRSEFTRIPYARGVVGMASAGKDTEGSQFFLTHSMQPHLDGGYTAFGRVTEGREVMDALLQNDVIRTATVETTRQR